MIEYTVKVYPNGTKLWYLNGQRHREDGPAVEGNNANKWFLNGQQITENEFNKTNVQEFNNRTQTKELTIKELEAKLGYKIKVVGE